MNSDEPMYDRQPESSDRFDQCAARHPRTGERCTKEADHPLGNNHSWGIEVRQAPEHQKKQDGLGDDEMWASGTRYVVPMRPFIWAMFAEMEVNEWKSAPDLWRQCDVPTSMGEIFYHVLKLAWLLKHKPEDKSAILEFTVDVANCAFIAAASLGAAEKGVPAPEEETRLGAIGDVEGFYHMFDAMKDWIVEYLGWTEEDMKFHQSDKEAEEQPPGDEREDGSIEHQWV